METQDILAATHQMEGSVMTHSQSETITEAIVAAVAPLATKEDLEATRADIAALRKETRADAQIRQDQFNSIKKPCISISDVLFVVCYIGIGISLVLSGITIGKSL